MNSIKSSTVPIDKFNEEQKKLWRKLSGLNTECQEPLSPRVQKSIRKLTENSEGIKLPEEEIQDNINFFFERIKVLIPQMQENFKWQMTLTPASKEEFEASPRTVFKSFQQIFTPDYFRQVFSHQEADRLGNSLDEMIIDAVMFNRTRLTNLGLAHCLAPKRSQKKIQFEYYARAIPEVKEMLCALEPFQVIDPETGLPKRKHDFETARLFKIGEKNREYSGRIFGLSEVNGMDSFYTAMIHNAKRRIGEIDFNQAEEIKMLEKIAATIRTIDSMVAYNWPAAKENIPQLKIELLEIVEQLKYVKKEEKVRIRKKIEKALDFSTITSHRARFGSNEDGQRVVTRSAQKKKVLNPGAMRAIWCGVPAEIAKREQSIRRISGHLKQDQQLLTVSIAKQQAPFSQILDLLLTEKSNPLCLDSAKQLSDAELRNEIRSFKQLAALFDPENPTNPQFFRPYEGLASLINRSATEASKLLSETQNLEIKKLTAKEIGKIYSLLALCWIYKSIQEIKDKHFVGSDEPFYKKIAEKIGKMMNYLSKPFGNEETRLNEFKPLLYELWKELRILKESAINASVAKAQGTEDIAKMLGIEIRKGLNECEKKIEELKVVVD